MFFLYIKNPHMQQRQGICHSNPKIQISGFIRLQSYTTVIKKGKKEDNFYNGFFSVIYLTETIFFFGNAFMTSILSN